MPQRGTRQKCKAKSDQSLFGERMAKRVRRLLALVINSSHRA